MPIIILRQDQGNTEPRSANVTVKNYPLLDSEVDNNFNNINNAIEYDEIIIDLSYKQANLAFDNSNTKFSNAGGTIAGDVYIMGDVSSNNIIGAIDAGIF